MAKRMTVLLVLLGGVLSPACQPASSPASAECETLPRAAHGCLDGNIMRPVGCRLAGGPTGPDSPGANCVCVERQALGVTGWDCKTWM